MKNIFLILTLTFINLDSTNKDFFKLFIKNFIITYSIKNLRNYYGWHHKKTTDYQDNILSSLCLSSNALVLINHKEFSIFKPSSLLFNTAVSTSGFLTGLILPTFEKNLPNLF